MPRRPPAPFRQCGQNLLIQHKGEFAGNARHANKNRALLFDHETRCGSHRVLEDLSTGRKIGLLSIGFVHLSAYPGEEGVDDFERGFVELEFPAECLGEHLGGEIIPGRPKAAGHQKDVAARSPSQECVAHIAGIVAHRTLVMAFNIELQQTRSDERLVGIDDFAAQHFITDGQYLGLHPAAPPGLPGCEALGFEPRK